MYCALISETTNRSADSGSTDLLIRKCHIAIHSMTLPAGKNLSVNELKEVAAKFQHYRGICLDGIRTIILSGWSVSRQRNEPDTFPKYKSKALQLERINSLSKEEDLHKQEP
jgi:hypothetical protein